MLKYIILFLSFFITSTLFGQSDSISNPEKYGKYVFDCLKRNDVKYFITNSFPEYNIIIDQFEVFILRDSASAKLNPHMTIPELKKKFEKEFIRAKESAKNGFMKFHDNDNINWKNCSYITTYYSVEKKPSYCGIGIASLQIKVKTDSRYFLLNIFGVVLVNKSWYGGDLHSIVEIDKYNEELNNESIGDETVKPVEDNVH